MVIGDAWRISQHECSPPLPQQPNSRSNWLGRGRLVSFKRETLASGEITDIFGKAPKGYITYGQDGRMMVLFVKDERPKPDDLAKLTDQQRADLFKTMYAYSGTYDLMARRSHTTSTFLGTRTGRTLINGELSPSTGGE